MSHCVQVTITSSDQLLPADVGREEASLSSFSLTSGGLLSGSVGVAGVDEEEVLMLPSLADMTATDTKYQSYTLRGEEADMGCTLRYFSIQPPASTLVRAL